MTHSLKTRIKALENRRGKNTPKPVVYCDKCENPNNDIVEVGTEQMTISEFEKRYPAGLVIVIQNTPEPQSTIKTGNYNAVVGIDMTQI